MGALKSKFVGESERNLRAALRVIEAIGRCVVWIDEIEKSLAGATQGAADGGVSSDALGTILGWMQERSGEAFVMATANDVSSLPPELLRRGRFDEIWYIDLPNARARSQIVRTALSAHGRHAPIWTTITDLVDATEGFSGAEIAALVPEALFAAFADGQREIATDDLVTAARTVVPLSKTMSERIEKLREWAKTRARPATTSTTTTTSAAPRVRAIDL